MIYFRCEFFIKVDILHHCNDCIYCSIHTITPSAYSFSCFFFTCLEALGEVTTLWQTTCVKNTVTTQRLLPSKCITETLSQVVKAPLTKRLAASPLQTNDRNSFLKWKCFFFPPSFWYLANWKFVYFLRGLFRKPLDTVNTTSFHAHYLPLDCFRLMSQ